MEGLFKREIGQGMVLIEPLPRIPPVNAVLAPLLLSKLKKCNIAFNTQIRKVGFL